MSSTATAVLVSALLVAIVILQVAYTHVVTRRDRPSGSADAQPPNIDVHVHVQLPEGLQVAPAPEPPARSIEQAIADAVVADVQAEEPAPPFVPSPPEQPGSPAVRVTGLAPPDHPDPPVPAPEPEPAGDEHEVGHPEIDPPEPEPEPEPKRSAGGAAKHVANMERRERAILQLVVGYPTGISDKQIAKHIGAPESSVKRSVKKLHGQGKLTLVREGRAGGGGRPALWGPATARRSPAPVPPEGSGAPAPLPESKPAPAKRVPPVQELRPVAEELRAMPAINGAQEARAHSIRAAEKQLAVLTFVKSRATVVPAEVHAAMPEIAQATISGYLRDLAKARLIRLTGRGRYAKGQKRGKGGLEYAPLEGEGKAADAKARDFARAIGRPFTTRELALGCVISVRDATLELKKLLDKGVVRATDVEGQFEYVKPDGPGRAAELDAARKAAQAPPAAGVNGGSAAVPGTGKGVKANNRDVQQLINDCVSAGANVNHAANGHFAVHKKGMERRILISATPKNPRSVLSDRARLRRAGLMV